VALSVQIPGYRIIKLLGEGGMATVYLAVQESLDREVALKVMSPMLAANESFCEQFIKEGRITAQLTHPNLVTVHDIGSHSGAFYLATEFLPGGTLRERMSRGLDIAEALDIARDLAHGLAYAHEKGFVHRDVKPGNVLFRGNGTAVLADFGIAKAMKSTSMATLAGNAIGTPDYMSPEQARATMVDGRSDLYSLGAVLFEMLVGHKPYRAGDPYAVALMHVTEPVPRMPAQVAWLQPLIDGMMAKDPENRFATGDVFVAECEKLLNTNEGQKLRGGPANKFRRVSTRLSPTPKGMPPIDGGSSAESTRFTPKRLAGAALVIVLIVVAVVVGQRFKASNPSIGPPPVVITEPAKNTSDPPVQKVPDVALDTPAGDLPPFATMDTGALLAQAEKYLEGGLNNAERPGYRLASPADDNATDMLIEVLHRDPANQSAKKGLARITGFYEQGARRAFEQGLNAGAAVLAENGLRADPQNAALKKLLADIEQRSK
jgi:serine/threonine-protein kinase PpkA